MNQILIKLISALRMPATRTIKNLDDLSATLLHAKILEQKTFLRKLYREWYQTFRESISGDIENLVLVELGSGGGFIKEIIPSAITSDVINMPKIDKRFSALNIPFKSGTVDAFFLLDVFHHINDVRTFLEEANRCLKTGGKIVLIEPANTYWGRFVYRRFHHEPFDTTADWALKKGGPFSAANGALPWIVFYRDRKVFMRDFPCFRIARLEPHTPFLYLLSGGFTLRQLLPSAAYGLIKRFEALISPFHKYLGMFLTIEIIKIS